MAPPHPASIPTLLKEGALDSFSKFLFVLRGGQETEDATSVGDHHPLSRLGTRETLTSKITRKQTEATLNSSSTHYPPTYTGIRTRSTIKAVWSASESAFQEPETLLTVSLKVLMGHRNAF